MTTLPYSNKDFLKDISAGTIVFLVALPLCLGISLASGAPLFSGILSGIIGGIIIGFLSGSHTSVSGPAAGLTVVVATQIATLGSFEAFLCAVSIAGLMQILLAYFKAGTLSLFFPTSVINGLLAAIGFILILKQIPHLVGHSADYQGDMSFIQQNANNTFTELFYTISNVHIGAAVVGIVSLCILIAFSQVPFLKKIPIQAPLLVVGLGIAFKSFFDKVGADWAIRADHLVQVPIFESASAFFNSLQTPDTSVLTSYEVYMAAATLAVIASLETLLNLEAVDKIDKRKRFSPPNRELFAQGIGNFFCGLVGAIPTTAVVVRGSVNVNNGSVSKVSAIFHGFLLLISVIFIPNILNLIPLATLAAILIFTGYKLASYALFQKMWLQGKYQFLPFLITFLSIVFTDLLIGVLIGLFTTFMFILASNLRQPIRIVTEKHISGNVLRIELANQVSFLNRATLEKTLKSAIEAETHILIDAHRTDYIDPDILGMIREFRLSIAPAHNSLISVQGFKDHYDMEDDICFIDFSTRELQDNITPDQVLTILKEGNKRFLSGQLLNREYDRQIAGTSASQHPLAVVLSCIDSRSPAEIIFDLGIGDIFSVRVAGNVIGPKVMGSIEYASAVAGSKLIVVLGHTKCGAVTASYDLHSLDDNTVQDKTGCQHIDSILSRVQESMGELKRSIGENSSLGKSDQVDELAKLNVLRSMSILANSSTTIQKLIEEKKVAIVGAMYDIRTGTVEFLDDKAIGLDINLSTEDYTIKDAV